MLFPNCFALATVIFSMVINAAPSPQRRDNTCTAPSTTSENANFDDIPGIIGTSNNPIPDLYKGLYYQGFTMADVLQTNLLPGPVPHSGHKYAFTNTINTLQGTAEMTTNYKETNSSSFDLKSFYYALFLQIPAQSATALNLAGYLDVTGYNGVNGQYEVCSQQLTYTPTSFLGVQQMVPSGTLDSCFTDLTQVIFTYSFTGGEQLLNPLIGVVLDDILYDLKYCPS